VTVHDIHDDDDRNKSQLVEMLIISTWWLDQPRSSEGDQSTSHQGRLVLFHWGRIQKCIDKSSVSRRIPIQPC